MPKTTLPLLSLAFGLSVLLIGLPEAFADKPKQFNISAKFGALMPGSVYIDPPDRDFDSDPGFFGWVDADAIVAPKFSVGVAGLLTIPDIAGASATVLAAGATLKARFQIESLYIRPGVLIAYQTIDVENSDESITGFNVGALIEAAYEVDQDGLRPVVQVGFISQPVGGSDCCDVSFAPIFYITAGAEFGR